VNWLYRVIAAHRDLEQVRSGHALVHHGGERYLALFAWLESRRTYDRLERSAPLQHLHIHALDSKGFIARVEELEGVRDRGVQRHLAEID
jgi:hypothetical protein